MLVRAMVDTTKIVFFGASSISFGLTTIKGVFSPQDLAGSTLTLVDIGEAKLARIPQFARLLNDRSGAGATIERPTEGCAASD